MRRNSSTVVVLAGRAPGEVLAVVGRSMNVALIRPGDSADSAPDAGPSAERDAGPSAGRDVLAAAAEALQRAGRVTSPYALVTADPLAALAASWREMWDVSRQPGPAGFEREAAQALAAWRAGRFELPDYYLVLAAAWPKTIPPWRAGPPRHPDICTGINGSVVRATVLANDPDQAT